MKHNPIAMLIIFLSSACLVALCICAAVIDAFPIGLLLSLLAFFLLLLFTGVIVEKRWPNNKWKHYYEEIVKPARCLPVSKKQRKKDFYILFYLVGGLTAVIVAFIFHVLCGLLVCAAYVAGLFFLGYRNSKTGRNETDDFSALFSLPRDYAVFLFADGANQADPGLYLQLTDILTGGRLNLQDTPFFEKLQKGGRPKKAALCYDEWIRLLRAGHYLCYLDCSVSLKAFVDGLNTLLHNAGGGAVIDAEKAQALYRQTLTAYGAPSEINVDVLAANTAAALLRENGLELVALPASVFAACNSLAPREFTVVPNDSLRLLQKLEARI